MNVVPHAGAQKLLALLVAQIAGGTFNLHYYVNNLIPGPLTVLADLTEATYAGYAAIAYSPTIPGNPNATGTDLMVDTFRVPSIASGVGLPTTVFGAYLTDSTDASLVAVGRFDVPWDLNNANDVLVADASLGLNNQLQDLVVPDLGQDAFTHTLFGALKLTGEGDVEHS